ncbi:hypothetical protein PanWU01x14_317950 [Parasponia andersonii]|uniref:Uncharacterized protein n=1 Tax=Parasponia andersonii TaxID=3476 RepID=A0A2P5AMH3_PARAD|nr:hypothetical protein PanWU01x14_317950 [Parasponia andersonii]
MSPGSMALMGFTWPPPMSNGSAVFRFGPSEDMSVPSVPVWEAAISMKSKAFVSFFISFSGLYRYMRVCMYVYVYVYITNRMKLFRFDSPVVTRADLMAAGDQFR